MSINLLTGKTVPRFSTGGGEFFNTILEELGESACFEDAAFLLRSNSIEPDVRLLKVVAAILRDERQKKLELHRQWQKIYQGLREELFTDGKGEKRSQ